MIVDYLKIILIGITAGFIAGFLGTATAPTIIFGLLIFKLVPNFKTAAGTTLLTILPPLSIFAVYEYYKRGELDIKYALMLMVVITFFERLGAKYNLLFSDKILKRLSAVYLYIIGTFMLYLSFQ